MALLGEETTPLSGARPSVALRPVVNDPPGATIILGEGGFDPDRLTVPPGTVIEWINGGLAAN